MRFPNASDTRMTRPRERIVFSDVEPEKEMLKEILIVKDDPSNIVKFLIWFIFQRSGSFSRPADSRHPRDGRFVGPGCI
jgi:hypothetical protein